MNICKYVFVGIMMYVDMSECECVVSHQIES